MKTRHFVYTLIIFSPVVVYSWCALQNLLYRSIPKPNARADAGFWQEKVEERLGVIEDRLDWWERRLSTNAQLTPRDLMEVGIYLKFVREDLEFCDTKLAIVRKYVQDESADDDLEVKLFHRGLERSMEAAQARMDSARTRLQNLCTKMESRPEVK